VSRGYGFDRATESFGCGFAGCGRVDGGVISWLSDPLGHVTTLTYDVLNRLATETNALGLRRRVVYDPRGLSTTETDGGGAVIAHKYDARGLRLEGCPSPHQRELPAF
jgi:YD repeat-containing protein